MIVLVLIVSSRKYQAKIENIRIPIENPIILPGQVKLLNARYEYLCAIANKYEVSPPIVKAQNKGYFLNKSKANCPLDWNHARNCAIIKIAIEYMSGLFIKHFRVDER